MLENVPCSSSSLRMSRVSVLRPFALVIQMMSLVLVQKTNTEKGFNVLVSFFSFSSGQGLAIPSPRDKWGWGGLDFLRIFFFWVQFSHTGFHYRVKKKAQGIREVMRFPKTQWEADSGLGEDYWIIKSLTDSVRSLYYLPEAVPRVGGTPLAKKDKGSCPPRI